MVEAQRRMEMGLMPQGVQPGQQITVDLTNATPRLCECGCKYFTQAVAVYTVSALVSPIGKELTAQQPVLICLECKEVLK
jgi:hypothetical protein